MKTAPSKVAKLEFKDLKFVTIDKYGWDQEGNKVKIYLMSGLDKIGSHDKNNIQVDFDSNSVDLKIRDFKGQNWRLRLEPLCKDIDVAECKMQIKSNSITLTLKKHENKHWSDLIRKDKEKKIPKMDEDPNMGLMNMMKELYENGDDNMKRTIAESWTKAQEKK